MIYFLYVLGGHFYQLGLFKVNVQIWKMFLGSLKFEYVLGMPDIPYILGVKSICWVQCQA